MELILKQGYKQTEIGLIPEDWEVKEFNDFGVFFKGKGIKKDDVKLEGIPCVRYGELYTKYDNLIKETFSFISNELALESFKLRKGDLLFAGSGEIREEIGKSAVILRDDTYAGGDIVIFRAKDIDPIFLGFISNSSPVAKQKAINGQGDAVVHIYSGGISKIKIPLPPTLTEQKIIAKALSDVDELISSLEKLIIKKKDIKQGTMQELLTPPSIGGKRLAGFNGEWTEINLGQSATLKARIGWQGLTTAEYLTSGNFRLVTGTDFKGGFIDWNNCVYVEKERYDQDKNIQLKIDDVLVTKDGTIGKVALINELPMPTTLNSGVFVIRSINNSFDQKFFYYVLMSKYFAKFLGKLTAGSTISHLYQKDFVHFNFFTPKSLEEQREIALILNDMDLEIEALEAKKAKYQGIKQGMMQELLTGKTRLV